jgi:hypothetical protein
MRGAEEVSGTGQFDRTDRTGEVASAGADLVLFFFSVLKTANGKAKSERGLGRGAVTSGIITALSLTPDFCGSRMQNPTLTRGDKTLCFFSFFNEPVNTHLMAHTYFTHTNLLLKLINREINVTTNEWIEKKLVQSNLSRTDPCPWTRPCLNSYLIRSLPRSDPMVIRFSLTQNRPVWIYPMQTHGPDRGPDQTRPTFYNF